MTLSQAIEAHCRAVCALNWRLDDATWREVERTHTALQAARDAAREAHRPVAERAAGRAGR